MVLDTAPTRHHLITKSVKDILGAADRAEPKLRRAILDALEALQGSATDLERLVASGRLEPIAAAIERTFLPRDLVIEIINASSGPAVATAGVAAAPFNMAFNQVNQRAIRWAEQNAAKLVTGHVDKALIRRIVTRGTTEGIHPRLTAKLLRDIIPIFDNHQDIVDRVYQAAINAGVTPEQAGKVAAKKSARYAKYRAEMVARTEAMRAANMGQQLAWETAIDLDLLPTGTKKIWLATGDDRTCKICAPMDGKTVAVVGEFTIDRQATSFTRSGSDFKVAGTKPYKGWGPQPTPPAHPKCRCTLILEPL